MTKQVLQFRVCDRCPTETSADVIDKVSLNGCRWTLDLCQKCSDELDAVLHRWGDLGAATRTDSLFDRQRKVAEPILLDPNAGKRRPEKIVLYTEDIVVEKPPTVRRSEPAHPLTAARWRVTTHAQKRITERGLSNSGVLSAAERPSFVTQSKTDVDLELRTLGNVTAVVNPYTSEIVTAYDPASWGAGDLKVGVQ